MPSRTVKKRIAVVQDILRQLRFPDRFNKEQTAHCVLADDFLAILDCADDSKRITPFGGLGNAHRVSLGARW